MRRKGCYMKRYMISVLRYLIFYLLSFLVFFLLSYIVNASYELLSGWFPAIVPSFSPVYEEEKYNMLEKILAFLTAILALYTSTHLAVVYDNNRFEHLIQKTDGFYDLGTGYSIYLKGYASADLIAATFVPLLISLLTFIQVPERAPIWVKKLIDGINVFLTVQNALTDVCGFIPGIVILLVLSVLFRPLAAYCAVRRFRAVWLSDTDGVEV